MHKIKTFHGTHEVDNDIDFICFYTTTQKHYLIIKDGTIIHVPLDWFSWLIEIGYKVKCI